MEENSLQPCNVHSFLHKLSICNQNNNMRHLVINTLNLVQRSTSQHDCHCFTHLTDDIMVNKNFVSFLLAILLRSLGLRISCRFISPFAFLIFSFLSVEMDHRVTWLTVNSSMSTPKKLTLPLKFSVMTTSIARECKVGSAPSMVGEM